KSSVWQSARPALEQAFFNKCVYCETPLGVTSRGDIAAFRPKSLYPWLAYEWENLLLACSGCNHAKADRFPLEDEKRRAPRPELVMPERPLLLNPCEDQPDEHLTFADNGQVVSDTKRGQATIDTLALNRPGLLQQRGERARWLAATLRRVERGANVGDE